MGCNLTKRKGTSELSHVSINKAVSHTGDRKKARKGLEIIWTALLLYKHSVPNNSKHTQEGKMQAEPCGSKERSKTTDKGKSAGHHSWKVIAPTSTNHQNQKKP